MTRPGISGVTVQIWRKEGNHPISDGDTNAGREALPAGPEHPSITTPPEVAVHLARELSASAVDDNDGRTCTTRPPWTGRRGPGAARAGAALNARLRTDRVPLGPGLLSTLSRCGQDRFSRCRRTGATPLHIAAAGATLHLHRAASGDAVAAVEVLLFPRGRHPCAGGRRRQAVGCRGGQARLEGGARCCCRAAPVRGRRTTTAPPPARIRVRERCIDTRAADDEWSVAHGNWNSGG